MGTVTPVCEHCEERLRQPSSDFCRECEDNLAEEACERYVNDGECFRGNEAQAFLAEEQAKTQRELK